MSPRNWVGETIGNRYEITELLGQGGMSAVYKANDPNLRRVVAVKLIHSHLSNDSEFVRRFEEEAAAVASLRHPNIIQVFDFDHDEEDYYIVFEFIPGESLQSHLARLNNADRKMPFKQVVDSAANISEALNYAHGRGMVHRDIKPANVMLNVMGQAILMDFGVVKIVGGDTHTATGAVLGTARYMSPEQIRGEKVDARTDIYSMGVMLFEMLSGEPPFQADSALTLMMMHVNDPVPDVRKIRSDVPEDLATIIERAMAKNPNERFQSGEQLAKALRSARLEATSGPIAAAAAVGTASQMQTVADMEVPAVPIPQEPTGQTQGVSGTSTAPQPVPTPVSPTGARTQTVDSGVEKKNNNMLIYGGIGVVALLVGCLVIAAVLAAAGVFSGDGGGDATSEAVIDTEATETAEAERFPTEEATEIVALPSETATSTATPTPTATSTLTQEPVATATEAQPTATEALSTATTAPTVAPSPTTAAGPFVRIDSIGVSGSNYVVNYTPIGYTPQLPGTHIHFFWNTIPPQNAGAGPTAETWFLYGGPNPFTGYTVGERPSGATQMCALVANPDHTIQLNTGNCYPLP